MYDCKKCNEEDPRCFHLDRNYKKKGASSAHLHPPELVFSDVKFYKGDRFLDLGCGIGDYSVFVSPLVGKSGMIYAYDINSEAIKQLDNCINSLCISNIKTDVLDITKALPLRDQSINICFLSTVLHCLRLPENEESLFNEIRRVLLPEGKLITIDCKPTFSHFGPPVEQRISAGELVGIASRYRFVNTDYKDLGYNYMLQFEKV